MDIGTGGPQSSSDLPSKVHVPALTNPFVMGGGIGAFTGYVAPNYLYGEAYNILYGIDNITPLMKQIMSFPFVTEISCTTGFIAGCAMYPLLHYPMFGIQNVPWMNFSGILLVSSGLLMYGIYSIDGDKHGVIAPNGSYVKSEIVPVLNSIVRLNVQKDKFETYSLTSSDWVGDADYYQQRQKIVLSVQEYQNGKDSWGKLYTFDNPVLAYLCHWFDRGIAKRFPDNIVTLKDSKELKKIRDAMHRTDLSIAFLAAARTRNEKSQDILILIEKVKLFCRMNGVMTDKECQRLLNSSEKASYGVELLMFMKQKNLDEIHFDKSKATLSIGYLENWIRKTAPGIILFKTDEIDCLKGMSVESQLENLSFPFNNDLESLKVNWEQIISDEERTRKRYTLVVVTGLLTTIFSGVLFA